MTSPQMMWSLPKTHHRRWLWPLRERYFALDTKITNDDPRLPNWTRGMFACLPLIVGILLCFWVHCPLSPGSWYIPCSLLRYASCTPMPNKKSGRSYYYLCHSKNKWRLSFSPGGTCFILVNTLTLLLPTCSFPPRSPTLHLRPPPNHCFLLVTHRTSSLDIYSMNLSFHTLGPHNCQTYHLDLNIFLTNFELL